MKRLGLILNPIAGMGGRVGLKGTDGREVLEKAIRLGALPRSSERALIALKQLKKDSDPIEIVTFAGDMGELVALQAGFQPQVIGQAQGSFPQGEDTVRAAQLMGEQSLNLLLFVGGDGTARNVYDGVGEQLPVLGVPAGVKIHSAVFAQSPLKAGELSAGVLKGEIREKLLSEVIDLDEDGIREGKVITRLYGYMNVPQDLRLIQSRKSSSPGSEKTIQQRIAYRVIQEMEPESLYLVGPGSTTAMVMACLKLKNTLLGVDLIQNRQVIANDLNEAQILNQIQGRTTYLILTPVGGQGYILGRGNQQLSPDVIRHVTRNQVIIIATLNKLSTIKNHTLLVDSGESALDQELCGYYRIITDDQDTVLFKVSA